MISMRVPSPSFSIYTVNSCLSQFFLHRCEDILMEVWKGSPSPMMLVHPVSSIDLLFTAFYQSLPVL